MADAAAEELVRKNLDGLYARVRGQIEIEIQLYNRRIFWLIAFEALLFAAVALLIQASVQAGSPALWTERINGLILIVCALAIVVAAISDQLLRNARVACSVMSRFWVSRVQEFPIELVQYYPHVEGGDGRNTRGLFFRSGLLPAYFAAAWTCVALVWFWAKLIEIALLARPWLAHLLGHGA